MNLYGEKWSRRELEKHIGKLDQVGGIRRITMNEGVEAGVELIHVRTGNGLEFYVSPMRGMDIYQADYMGVPLSWISPNGNVHPAYYDARGTEWMRTAAGGLLMTCGLTQVGTPNEYDGEELGLHGRVHHLAARNVIADGEWLGDEYKMRIKGVIEETTAIGENLRLTREYIIFLGKNIIDIHDKVENIGFQPSPHMMLYHFNFGFPLISKHTEFKFPSSHITPRDSGTSIEGFNRWAEPVNDYEERVYYHEDLSKYINEDGEQKSSIEIINSKFPCLNDNSRFPLKLKLSWNVNNLPMFTQWKMNRSGVNVLGIEPGNCHVEGRYAEKQRGSLTMLEPGETIEYKIRVEV